MWFDADDDVCVDGNRKPGDICIQLIGNVCDLRRNTASPLLLTHSPRLRFQSIYNVCWGTKKKPTIQILLNLSRATQFSIITKIHQIWCERQLRINKFIWYMNLVWRWMLDGRQRRRQIKSEKRDKIRKRTWGACIHRPIELRIN